jgi:hypothetical protein
VIPGGIRHHAARTFVVGELQQTIETDFNERFRNEAAGSSALFGEEEEEEKDHVVGP